jgi:hypothetical protein
MGGGGYTLGICLGCSLISISFSFVQSLFFLQGSSPNLVLCLDF